MSDGQSARSLATANTLCVSQSGWNNVCACAVLEWREGSCSALLPSAPLRPITYHPVCAEVTQPQDSLPVCDDCHTDLVSDNAGTGAQQGGAHKGASIWCCAHARGEPAWTGFSGLADC